ncbi:MAG TPA: hypothetical protein VFE42_13555 [Chloroflexota bacterium]|nr:hypothetical protein [Chloroflexota bacterium]
MSNESTGGTASTRTDMDDMSEVRKDPVLKGSSALTDPNLSGSTASTWTGTGGPAAAIRPRRRAFL